MHNLCGNIERSGNCIINVEHVNRCRLTTGYDCVFVNKYQTSMQRVLGVMHSLSVLKGRYASAKLLYYTGTACAADFHHLRVCKQVAI